MLQTCPAARAGSALVESILALVLLGSGALALVGATAAAIRVVDEGDEQVTAIAAARNRVELLAAEGCQTLPAGIGFDSIFDSITGLRESWRVDGGGSTTRFATDSVEFADRAGRRRVAVAGRRISC
jgi:Tfp pilus assembly protein PilV